MSNKEIKYEDLSLIGMELFRKNNETFMRSKLSPVMKKIFVAANHKSGIDNADNEYYMKSGILPNRIFYIYSDNLAEKDESKLYDIVNFNGDICIWFYSTNVINTIGNDPVVTITNIYNKLINIFRKNIADESSESIFINTENTIVETVMVVRLLKFLHETYGILDIDECKKTLIELISESETVEDFIDDILDNCDNEDYFSHREYLVSYLLL